jgi:hypothetical protein
MKHYKIIFMISILIPLASCGKNEQKIKKSNPTNTVLPKESIVPNKINTDTVTLTNKDSLPEIEIQKPIPTKKINNPTPTKAKIKTLTLKEPLKEEDLFDPYANFKKMLSNTKIGEIITQKELTETHHLPEEGVKLIKSIVKLSKDEIAIQWKSTWMIEKISDAKFKDSKLKIKFDKNQMYTSGDAIGIKYNKKIYTDLIIKSGSAYIPTVKGYYWQIGK